MKVVSTPKESFVCRADDEGPGGRRGIHPGYWSAQSLTTNMFGDIITDLGAMIQGGLGVVD